MRLQMWEFKTNYRIKFLDYRCPMCQSDEDATEHVLECNKRGREFNLNDEREKGGRDSHNL